MAESSTWTMKCPIMISGLAVVAEEASETETEVFID